MKDKKCEAFLAPFDVRFLNKEKSTADKEIFTVVQPDISIICDAQKLDKRGCLGAPDMIVEILSPATAQRDLEIKYKLYEEQGVREYWIVFPKDQNILIFDLDKQTKKYVLRGTYGRYSTVQVGVLADCKVMLSEVFPELED